MKINKLFMLKILALFNSIVKRYTASCPSAPIFSRSEGAAKKNILCAKFQSKRCLLLLAQGQKEKIKKPLTKNLHKLSEWFTWFFKNKTFLRTYGKDRIEK